MANDADLLGNWMILAGWAGNEAVVKAVPGNELAI
jgi:hypothetical protein